MTGQSPLMRWLLHVTGLERLTAPVTQGEFLLVMIFFCVAMMVMAILDSVFRKRP